MNDQWEGTITDPIEREVAERSRVIEPETNTEYIREWTTQLLTRESERRFRPTADRWGVFDTVLGVVVERNQYPQDVAYICRRLNAGLSYVPGGHPYGAPPKVYPPLAQEDAS